MNMNARNYAETKAIRRLRALERACESAKEADTAFFKLNQQSKSTGEAYRLHLAARQLREQIEAMSDRERKAILAPTIEDDHDPDLEYEFQCETQESIREGSHLVRWEREE